MRARDLARPYWIGTSLAVTLLFAACDQSQPTDDARSGTSSPSATSAAAPPWNSLSLWLDSEGSTPATISFSRSGVQVSAVCNQLGGAWGMSGDGTTLMVSDLVTTDVFCGEVGALREAALIDLLEEARITEREAGRVVLSNDILEVEAAVGSVPPEVPAEVLCEGSSFDFAGQCVERKRYSGALPTSDGTSTG